MNPLNLYNTLAQLFLKANPNDHSTWEEFYRLVPDLRNILCCVVCEKILSVPLTPCGTECQHHICRKCKGGKRNIKPACKCSEDCNYNENKSLGLLVQCYKNLCVRILNSEILVHIQEQAKNAYISTIAGIECEPKNLIKLLKEGALIQDDYDIKKPKFVSNNLSRVYKNSTQPTTKKEPTIKNIDPSIVIHEKPLYSISRFTLKRKSQEAHSDQEVKSDKGPKVRILQNVLIRPPVKSWLQFQAQHQEQEQQLEQQQSQNFEQHLSQQQLQQETIQEQNVQPQPEVQLKDQKLQEPQKAQQFENPVEYNTEIEHESNSSSSNVS